MRTNQQPLFIHDFHKFISEIFCAYYMYSICLEACQISRGICASRNTHEVEKNKKTLKYANWTQIQMDI